MPDPAQMATFEREIAERLQAPVNAYFETLERAARPVSGFGALLQPLTERLTMSRALARLRRELRDEIRLAYQVAGNLGNNLQAMDDQQMREVMAKIAEAENYLDGFLADVGRMTRAQALARIARYMPPVIQTVSVTATSDLPQLPIRPGDERLECVRKAHGIRVCRCYLKVVRVGRSDWDVTWVQTAAESCADCERLGQTWNPLRIRNGRIVQETKAPPPPVAKALPPVAQKSLGNSRAMIALYPPVTLASDLERLALGVLPTAEQADDLHVTILFLGEAAALGERAALLRAAVEDFAARRDPITARLNGTARFDSAASDDGTPYVALVDSPQLPGFRQALFEAVQALGVEPVANHGFIPHVTLAYLPNAADTPTLFLPETDIVFEKLSLVVGDARYDFPFRLPQAMDTRKIA